jgi:uncharacterized membrane protein YfhO
MNIKFGIKKVRQQKWLVPSNEKYRLRQYFALYTLLFGLVCFLVFCWYFLAGRTFIWSGDGWNQHYKALVYYARYMRSIAKELVYNHRLVFPEWDFAFGEGNDILQTLHYYVIGDPFAVLSVFVPTRFLWLYYDFMILLRLYLAGITFSYLCFYTNKSIGRYAVMAGALSYVFCSWSIVNANRHPYFLNPLLYFPLVILGIERILKEEKKSLLTVSVFVAAISNFYYFYVIVLMTVAYVVVRLIVRYKKDFKSILKSVLQIAGSSILGTMMGSVILLPVLFSFMNDARMASGNAWHFTYPLSYYSNLLGAFFGGSGNYWLHFGYSSPVILAIILLFLRKKKYRTLKVCFFVCIAIILIPALGQILNGMSYMSNKWCWAFALLCAYIFSVMWQDLMNLGFGDAVKLAIGLCVCFFGLLTLEYSRTKAAFACIGIAFVFLLVLFPVQIEKTQMKLQWKRYRQALALTLVIVGICSVSFFRNASAENNYAAEGKETADVAEQLQLTETNIVNQVASADEITDFYRYSGRSLTTNGNVLIGLSSTQYFWSISNPYISDYMKETELIETLPQMHSGYDDRTALLALSSVLYYVVPSSDSSPLPYGFTYVDTFNVKGDITEAAKALLMEELGTEELSDAQIKVIENATASKYKIYRNEYALPIAYAYNSTIDQETWTNLSAVEKQEAMLQSVLLADYEGETQELEMEFSSQPLEYTIECNSTGITLEDYGFVVTTANSSATINFEGLTNSETYFTIKGLDFDGVSTYELYFGDDKYDPLNLFTKTKWNLLSYADRESVNKNWLFWTEPTGAKLVLKASSGVSKTINYYTEDYTWYNDRHDFTVNLDYSENAVTSLTITFSAVGVYSFDSIEIISQPLDSYVDQVSSLKYSDLENLEISTDTVSGTVTLEQPKIICFSIPYSAGWIAYVDGEETTIYQANVKNMAVVLDEGTHNITLTYHTPYLRLGAIISAGGFAIYFVIQSYEIHKRKIRKANVHLEVEQ